MLTKSSLEINENLCSSLACGLTPRCHLQAWWYKILGLCELREKVSETGILYHCTWWGFSRWLKAVYLYPCEDRSTRRWMWLRVHIHYFPGNLLATRQTSRSETNIYIPAKSGVRTWGLSGPLVSFRKLRILNQNWTFTRKQFDAAESGYVCL